MKKKKNPSLVFSGSRKIPTLGSSVQLETQHASFPTGTVGPQVGIFLSPLNTNDGFSLFHMVKQRNSQSGVREIHILHNVCLRFVVDENKLFRSRHDL